jgi:uncharacterized protein YcbK (DUF882 family)
MQVTKNFNLNEFNSKCGRPMPENIKKNIVEMVQNLQIIRDEVKVPISITSGYRSPEHNVKVKGAKDSQHVKGTAVDFKVQGLKPEEVAVIVERLIKEGKIKQGGIGIYPSWVHYDIRGVKARW